MNIANHEHHGPVPPNRSRSESLLSRWPDSAADVGAEGVRVMNKGGWGCLSVIATFMFIGFACDVDTPPPVDPVKQAAEQKAAELATKKEAAIAAQKKHRISQREKHDVAKFRAEIERRNIGDLITSTAVSRKHLTVTVANSWHYEPYAIRLQMAQNLYKMWFVITDVNDEESVRVTINDVNGNRVGGQDNLYGVWVDK